MRLKRPPVELAARVEPGAVFENVAGERVLVLQVKTYMTVEIEVAFPGSAVTPMDFESPVACAEWLQDGGFLFVGHVREDRA